MVSELRFEVWRKGLTRLREEDRVLKSAVCSAVI